MSRFITCTNEDGLSIRFGYGYTPWLLTDVEGIYLAENNVYTSENTMTDGATYQGTTIKMRNIVLTMEDKEDHKHNRQLLYDIFKPKAPGVFDYEEEGETRSINYYVESVDISSLGKKRIATISLICPDPYFTAPNDLEVFIAGWEPLFEFVHEFQFGGEPLGGRSTEKLTSIINDSAADNIGITITITVAGDVTNPSVTRVESNQTIKVGTGTNPLNLTMGDVLTITTHTNNKHVYLTREGSRREINTYLDESSEFIQLMRGSNSIGFDADSGSEHMTVSIAYRYKYLGV